MKTFLGIGAGPIQTGIFVSGATRGGYDRIVLADVDPKLSDAVKRSGTIVVNTACSDAIRTDTYRNIEIYNPTVPRDVKKLAAIAAEATAIATALPSTACYRQSAPWLRSAFECCPGRTRYVYTAENSTTAADELQQAVGAYPATYYLDTVIGKMSKVFTKRESSLPTLAPGLECGHLVEEYNDIYTSSAPGIDGVGIKGLYPKQDLEPFEAAKLYGHNTCHFLLGVLASDKGCTYVDEASDYPDVLAMICGAILEECGPALSRRYGKQEAFVAPRNFTPFALQLTARMVSPLLRDSVERVIRDPERKLGWNDRLIGAIRLCVQQGVTPTHLLAAVVSTCRKCVPCGDIPNFLRSLWRNAPSNDAEPLITRIFHAMG